MRTNYSPEGRLGDAGTIEHRILAYEPKRMLSIRVAKAPDNFPFRERIGEMLTILYFGGDCGPANGARRAEYTILTLRRLHPHSA